MFWPQTAVPIDHDQLAGAPARRRSSSSGRRPVLPRGVAGRPPRHDEHGHARRRRHERGLGVQRRRDALRRGVFHEAGLAPGDLLRQRRRSSSASSCSGAGSRRGRRAEATGAIRRLVGLQADVRPARARAVATRSVPLERGPARRSPARPAGRAGAGRRACRRGRLGGRRVDAHRRGRARDEGSRRRGHRRDPATRPARS